MTKPTPTRRRQGGALTWRTPKGTDWMCCVLPDCRRRGRHIPVMIDRYEHGDVYCDRHRREMQAAYNAAAGRDDDDIEDLPIAPDNRTGNLSRTARAGR